MTLVQRTSTYTHTPEYLYHLRALFSECFWQNKYTPQLGQPNYNESCVLYLRSLWIFFLPGGKQKKVRIMIS